MAMPAQMGAMNLVGMPLEAAAIRLIPQTLAISRDVLSISSEGNELTVAIPDANDREAIDSIRFATGMQVRALQAPRDAIRAALRDAYGFQSAPDMRASRDDAAPAIAALDSVHADAFAAGASDVHLEPTEQGGRARIRVDGTLRHLRAFEPNLFAQVVSRVKLLAGMDIADRRQPQDGGYRVHLSEGAVDLRASSMPTVLGEKIALRLPDQKAGLSLDDLGMTREDLARFRYALHARSGFIVICGPTGSGKTTTLYAALAEHNANSQNICTVEDPVEARLPGVTQVQVNVRTGVTFGAAFRALLRQDPNLIVLGEMRDAESAAIAFAAALSGQMVMTTLHSAGAPTAFDRLSELGISRATLAAGMSLLVAQRLERGSCVQCIGASCALCGGSGVLGRRGVFELLPVDDAVRTQIAAGASAAGLMGASSKGGFATCARRDA